MKLLHWLATFRSSPPIDLRDYAWTDLSWYYPQRSYYKAMSYREQTRPFMQRYRALSIVPRRVAE